MKKIIFLTYALLIMVFKVNAMVLQEDQDPLYEINYIQFLKDNKTINSYILDNQSSNYGFLSKKGNQITTSEFDQVTSFFGEYANVIKDTISGYINKVGEVKWFPQYNKVLWYYHDVGVALKDEKFALINRDGTLITEFVYDEISFSNGRYYKIKINDKIKVIDDTGKTLFDNYIIEENELIYNNKIVVSTNTPIKREGLIDMKGNILITPVYDKLYSSLFTNGSYLIAKLKNIVFHFDVNGKEIKKDKNAKSPFVIMYIKNNKYGFLDLHRKFKISGITYTKANKFSEDLAMVEKNGKAGFINKKGRKVISFKYLYDWRSSFNEGFSVVKFKNEKFGYINKQGDIIVPGIYDEASKFQEGLAKVEVEVDGKKMLIDTTGTQIVPPIYDDIWTPREAMIQYQVNSKED